MLLGKEHSLEMSREKDKKRKRKGHHEPTLTRPPNPCPCSVAQVPSKGSFIATQLGFQELSANIDITPFYVKEIKGDW